MNLEAIVVVMLRLVALKSVLDCATTLIPYGLSYLRFYGESFALAVIPPVIVVAFAGAAVLLWMLAIPIARLVTRRLPQEVFLGSFSLADCYSTAFLGVGLYYIAGWVGTAVNWTHYLLKTAGTTPMPLAEKLNLYEVLQSFIPFVAGIVLLVKGRSWAMKLAARHAKAAASQPS